MSKRPRRLFPELVASNKLLETKECSDKDKRTYERFLGPAQAALSTIQNAINNDETIIVESMLASAGLDASKGWKFNREKMRWERYPVPKEG